MTDNIEVMGISLDCLTAKESMIRTMQFMEKDSVDIIEILSMDVLLKNSEDEGWRELIHGFGLTLPGDPEILKAADIADRVRLKETENHTFFRMFMRYLRKNHKKVFLLADTQEALIRTEEAIEQFHHGMRLTGKSLLADPGREENVINEINGTETDCILSVLSSPYQEQFINRNIALLNAKVWFGCRSVFSGEQEKAMPLRRLKRFFTKKLFWRRAVKEQQNIL